MHSRRADTSAGRVDHLVRRYFAVVADLASTEDDLRALLDPDVLIVEHPNAVNPHGSRRDLKATIAGFHAGKRLLRHQQFDIHEVLAVDDRAAIRATWKGTIGTITGPYRPGHQLVAHVAALVTFQDEQIVRHESFDCYDPITGAP
jgi:ketosteroid isomerase-like protein